MWRYEKILRYAPVKTVRFLGLESTNDMQITSVSKLGTGDARQPMSRANEASDKVIT